MNLSNKNSANIFSHTNKSENIFLKKLRRFSFEKHTSFQWWKLPSLIRIHFNNKSKCECLTEYSREEKKKNPTPKLKWEET